MCRDSDSERCECPVQGAFPGRFAWTPDSNRYGWTAYLGRAPRISDAPEYASPARRSDLSGLAPAWVGVGEFDVFHDEDDEDVAYAVRLKSCGVKNVAALAKPRTVKTYP